MTPTIHLNGTGKVALVSAIEAASQALIDALQLLSETAPNGRDYYPQGPDAIRTATQEHLSRLDRVKAVREELMSIWEKIEDDTAKGAR